MQKARCIVAAAPVREHASHASQMVTQLLFGEIATIIQQTDGWCEISCDYDGYKGFIQSAQITRFDNEEEFEKREVRLVENAIEVVPNKSGDLNVPLGGEIIASQYRIEANLKPAQAVVVAQKLLNTPYLWGGRSFYGIDCSGLVQICFKLIGIKMPRDAYQQAELGETIIFVDEAIPGDLVFFDNEEGRITHVGIIHSKGKIIHSYGRVRIDEVDQHGIFNKEENRYTHRFRTLKRLN